jgi:hypothetical protein
MHKLTCEHVRRELDELKLNDEINESTSAHLNECSACEEFHATQLKLRRLVGSLGTVQAPADFDFKLRARLASEPVATGFNFWPIAKWSLTAVAAVLLFVGGFSMIRTVTKQTPSQPVQQGQTAVVIPPAAVPQATATPVEVGPTRENDTIAQNSTPTEIPQRYKSSVGSRREKRTQVSLDSSSEGARVIRTPVTGREDVIFAVDAKGAPLTVSLDDGRGNARTISLPTVTFGSQRVVGNSNQFAAKGVW